MALARVVSLNAVECTLVRVVLQEMQSVSSASDAEKLLLYHGERIVDLLGAEINQIERSIQVNISLLAYTVHNVHEHKVVGCMLCLIVSLLL